MLSKPICGWTNFSLGSCKYELGYLTNIPIDWLDSAISGLQALRPFTVNGHCEPGRFLCTVSYWNCHIIFEDDENVKLDKSSAEWHIVHINMLQFCEMLYKDINSFIDNWAGGWSYEDLSKEERDKIKEKISARLAKLQMLIEKRAECFGPDRCFG